MPTGKRSEQNQPSPRLRARALAIINSNKYDSDTRDSIAFQLRTNYSDLADMVRDAEKGVTICDTVMVREEQREAARQVLALINKSAAPDFLTTAMMVSLQQAAAIQKIDLWTATANEAEELNVDALAELFAVSRMLDLKPASPQERLAAALVEILTNEETPDRLRDAVEEFVTEAADGPIAQRWTLPGSQAAIQHLLTFVQWKQEGGRANA